MKKIFIPLLALLALSCARTYDETITAAITDGNVDIWGEEASEDDLIKGRITVRVSEELAAELEKSTSEDGTVKIECTKAPSAGVTSMRRLFPDAGKFEPRHRKYGLHLWYEMEYDPQVSATKAVGDILSLGGIEEVEYPVKIRPAGSSNPFDDPRLSSQWNYYNDGSAASSSGGCDINVLPVWKNYTTGTNDVIVAVVDGGVDYTHEDLADNMWYDSSTKSCGFNFVKRGTVINPEDHGTHVAGTIAAVNNNGKGVCGIAGGDATKKKTGVRIMSCQIFDGNDSGSGAEAIVWACDHGAVIAQNSWGLNVASGISGTLKTAAKYFTENAGTDENGMQTGPIKGGLVIFAAGNSDDNKPYGTYDPSGNIINVASIGADYRRAYYSNYGDWVDICAPGGDMNRGNGILSTVKGNKYGTYQGTSMACPHVSGVAALIISAKKGSGVTAASVRKLLLNNVTDISSFNPNYKIGSGLVNCYKAIAGTGGKAPASPTDLKATVLSNIINVSVTIPKDEDDKQPTSIAVYYSTSPFTSSKGLEYAVLYVGDQQAGETLTGSIGNLEFNTKYYLAAEAVDLAGNHSKLSSQISATTLENIPPVINPHGASITMKGHETRQVKFVIENPTRHYFDISTVLSYRVHSKYFEGVEVDTLDKSAPVITFNGIKLKDDSKGSLMLKVQDIYGGTDSCFVDFTVEKNRAPYKVKEFGNTLFNSRNDDPVKFTASDYFKDDDGETLSYEISLSGSSVNFVHENGEFILTPIDYGYTDVSVNATDCRSEKTSQSFRVLVRNSTKDVEVYPTNVSRYLYLRSSDTQELTQNNALVSIISATGQTIYSGEMKVSAFTPGTIDMSAAGAGAYSVKVDYTPSSGEKKTFKYNIVKL